MSGQQRGEGFAYWLLAALAALAVSNAAAAGLTLRECVTEALQANPQGLAALHRLDAARAAIREAESAYYPQVLLSGSYTRTDNAGQALFMSLNQRRLDMTGDLNRPGDTGNLRLSVGAQLPVFDGGRRGLERAMAVDGAEAAKAGAAAVRNELVYQVTRAYYGVLEAQAFVLVQQESVLSLAENLRVASERLRAGSAVKTDVLNLQVQLAQAQEDFLRASNAVQLARAALTTVVGHPLAGEPEPAAADPATLPPPPAVSGDESVEQRPELDAAIAARRIGETGRQRAACEYWPTVNAFGSYDWDSEQADDFEHSYLVGVNAQWPLFNGFRRHSALAGARARAEAAAAEETQARNNLQLDLTRAALELRSAWDRLGVTRQSMESADEALRITRERYQSGAADLSALLTAQTGLTGMRTRKTAALYDYLIALANVARAEGTLESDYAPGTGH